MEGGNANAAAGGREGERGEDPGGSTLPTYGEDAHLQPTDATQIAGIRLNSNMALR